jgi:hypothetical protein
MADQTFSYVFMAFYIVEALNGMGMHSADIPPHILLKQMKVSIASNQSQVSTDKTHRN